MSNPYEAIFRDANELSVKLNILIEGVVGLGLPPVLMEHISSLRLDMVRLKADLIKLRSADDTGQMEKIRERIQMAINSRPIDSDDAMAIDILAYEDIYEIVVGSRKPQA